MARARVRIGRVRLKAGGELRLLPSASDPVRADTMRAIGDLIDDQRQFAGYAFVAWGADGGSSCSWWLDPSSPVLTVLVPEFVRSRLAFAIGVRWSLDDVNASWGPPS